VDKILSVSSVKFSTTKHLEMVICKRRTENQVFKKQLVVVWFFYNHAQNPHLFLILWAFLAT